VEDSISHYMILKSGQTCGWYCNFPYNIYIPLPIWCTTVLDDLWRVRNPGGSGTLNYIYVDCTRFDLQGSNYSGALLWRTRSTPVQEYAKHLLRRSTYDALTS
jgi:hypothetical protein